MSPKQAMQLRASLFRIKLSRIWNTVVDHFAPHEHSYDRSMGVYDHERQQMSHKDRQWYVILGIVGYTFIVLAVALVLLMIYLAVSGT